MVKLAAEGDGPPWETREHMETLVKKLGVEF